MHDKLVQTTSPEKNSGGVFTHMRPPEHWVRTSVPLTHWANSWFTHAFAPDVQDESVVSVRNCLLHAHIPS